MAFRTGIAILTTLVKHACRVLTTYRAAMSVVIDAAVTGGTITSAQRTTLNTWLDGMQAACDILKVVSGY
jgi:hypothetical protein